MVKILTSGLMIVCLMSLCRHSDRANKYYLDGTGEYVVHVNYPGVKMELTCISRGSFNIEIFMTFESDSSFIVYPGQLSILRESNPVKYVCTIYDNEPNKAPSSISDSYVELYYKTVELAYIRSENIKLYADSILFTGEDFYDMDTLSFSVKDP